MNLFENIKQTLNREVVEQLAKDNQESPEKIAKTVDALSASLVAGLLKRTATESGANALYKHIQQVDFQPEQIAQFINNTAQLDSFRNYGDKTLNVITPGVKSPISIMISRYVGTRTSLVSSLAGFVFSTILTILKKQTQDKKWNAEALASFLGDQREPLLAVVPDLNDTMIDSLGIDSLLKNYVAPRSEQSADINKTEHTTERFIETESSEGTDMRSYLKWLMLGLVVIGIGAAGYYFWNQYQATSDTDAEQGEEVMVDTTTEAKIIAEPIVGDSVKKDTIQTTPVATLSTPARSEMEAYLTDTTAQVGKTFKWEGVDFNDNTAQLKTQDAINKMVDLLKKYPNAQIKIIGYANDAQLPNTHKTLSIKRVVAVKDMLIKAGINYIRIDAEGKGTGATTPANKSLREFYVKFVKK